MSLDASVAREAVEERGGSRAMTKEEELWNTYRQDSMDDFDEEPVVDDNYASYGRYQLVGHGRVTNSNCGKFSSFFGCLRTDLHNKFTLDGNSYRGKVYVKKVFHSCDKPSCPKCFKHGWAVREAHKIEVRLAEASRRFGLVEHIIGSVPPEWYGLNHEELRVKIKEGLSARGIIGGVLIFHGFRYSVARQWYWSPHFHFLGFILGGYEC